MKTWFLCLATAAVSGMIGYFLGVKTGEKKAEILKEKLDEYYDVSDEYRRTEKKEDEEAEDSGLVQNEEMGFRNGEKRERKKVEKTDYAGIYQVKNKPEEGASKMVEQTLEQQANEEHERDFDKEPEEIGTDALGEIPKWVDRQTFFYFAYDGIITNEDHEEVDDPEILFGTVIEDSGFNDNAEEMIFIRNYQTDCLYTLQKQFAAFSEIEG